MAGIASRQRERAEAWVQARLDDPLSSDDEVIRVFDNYAALLAASDIDWVYIALPPSLHFEWSRRALEQGKNVLCEKPLCVNARQAEELARLASAKRCFLAHATSFPFHPRSLAMREVLRSNELGELRRVHVACSFGEIMTRGNDHRTDSMLGGGCLLDLGWYCVMATLWFTGLQCRRVRSVGSKHEGVWYQVQTLAELSDGTIAHWDCGFDAAPRRWIEIAGSQDRLFAMIFCVRSISPSLGSGTSTSRFSARRGDRRECVSGSFSRRSVRDVEFAFRRAAKRGILDLGP